MKQLLPTSLTSPSQSLKENSDETKPFALSVLSLNHISSTHREEIALALKSPLEMGFRGVSVSFSYTLTSKTSAKRQV